MPRRNTILVVDYNEADRRNITQVLGKRYNILEAQNADQGFILCEDNLEYIAAIILSTNLPDKDEITVLKEINKRGYINVMDVVVLTDKYDSAKAEEIFEYGVLDIIVKPITEIQEKRVSNIIDMRRKLAQQEQEISDKKIELSKENDRMIDILSEIIEKRNAESSRHISRVREFTRILLTDMATHYKEYRLDENKIDLISRASVLHDIGKIVIPDSILNKKGKFTQEEHDIIKSHTVEGARIVEQMAISENAEYFRYAYNICLYHHERFDGGGYPNGLVGEDIPICAQVVGLADAYDALTNKRIYKEAYPHEQAVNMIMNGACGTFSPNLLSSFKSVRTSFLEIPQEYSEEEKELSEYVKSPLQTYTQEDGVYSTASTVQEKQNAVLQYLHCTVIEYDARFKEFHLIYNEGYDFDMFKDTEKHVNVCDKFIAERVHPDDYDIAYNFGCTREWLESNVYRRNLKYRIMNAQSGEYVTYEQSAIKINTPQGISKRKVMLFWKRISDVEIHEGDFDVMLNHELKDLGIAIIYSVANESLSLSGFSANLLHLTGYTEKEIKEEFGGNLWKLIHEEDKKTALEEYLQQRRSGNTINLTYRIRRKNGQAIWVYQIGRLYTENSQEHFCSVLINISEQKKEADNLRRMRDAYRRLVERGSDMTFKWDMRTDTLYFPEEFKDFFGYEPISSFASSKLFNSSHVHPSDIKNVERIYKAFLVGSDYQETEIRIAGSSGKYKWFGVKASMEKDEADEPLAVIGILNDIDNEKNMLASLQEQANLDSLTNIANKRHASKKIEKALTEVGEEAKAAMWIMDIDYFKDINDKYGHHVGDLVLVKMAQTLESMFRKDDIVARIGGDEFLIYMKNIKSEEDIKKKSKILINKVRNLFSDEEKDIKITCSVGISIAPKDGNDYNVLYQKADRALYHAKNAGRNRAVIYIEGWNQSRGLSEDMERRTALDSDSVLPLTVRYESMLRFVQRTLVESKNIKKSINDVLRLVGDEFGVSRAYIFENTKDNTCCNNTFEWCSEGIVSQIDVLQNLNYEKDLGGDYLDNFNEWGTFYCHDIDLLPQKQYQILEPQGIKSMLQVLLKDKGEAIGFLGFDQCNVKRMWREDEISTLQFIAFTLAPYIANYTTK